MGQRTNQTLSLLRKDFILKFRFPIAYFCTLMSQSFFVLFVWWVINLFMTEDE